MSYADWRGLFLEAVDEGLYPAAWLDKRVETGRARLLENGRGACLVEIKVFPSGAKEVHCLVAAGEIDAIKALAPQAEAWGRKCKAVQSAIESSPAWAKIMRDLGYEVEQVRIVKRLL